MKEEPQEHPPVAELDEEDMKSTFYSGDVWPFVSLTALVCAHALPTGTEALLPAAACSGHGPHDFQQHLVACSHGGHHFPFWHSARHVLH